MTPWFEDNGLFIGSVCILTSVSFVSRAELTGSAEDEPTKAGPSSSLVILRLSDDTELHLDTMSQAAGWSQRRLLRGHAVILL